jgi:hypothetical protein
VQVCGVLASSSHPGTDLHCQVPNGCSSSWGSTSLATSEHGSILFLRFLTLFLSLPLVLQNSVGLSNTLSRLLAACNSVSYLAFSFLGLLLIERAGRRKLMMWGAAGQCVCYIFIAALLSRADGSANGSKFGAGATAFFFIYYIFFGVCWQVGGLVSCCELDEVQRFDYIREFLGYTQRKSTACQCAHTAQH